MQEINIIDLFSDCFRMDFYKKTADKNRFCQLFFCGYWNSFKSACGVSTVASAWHCANSSALP